jgi:hypothetical protein
LARRASLQKYRLKQIVPRKACDRIVHKKGRCVGLNATLLDFPRGQLSERSVVEAGGFHRYKIVYIGFSIGMKTAVSY